MHVLFQSAINNIWIPRLADEENGFILAERVASRMDTEGRADAKIDAQFAAMIEKLDEGNKTILRV